MPVFPELLEIVNDSGSITVIGFGNDGSLKQSPDLITKEYVPAFSLAALDATVTEGEFVSTEKLGPVHM